MRNEYCRRLEPGGFNDGPIRFLAGDTHDARLSSFVNEYHLRGLAALYDAPRPRNA